MKPSFVIVVLLLLIFSTTSSSALPWNFSFGMFKFDATDYYYPNFYEEGGFRGELGITLRSDKKIYVPLKCQMYGYPGDDNVFEYCPEIGLGFRFGEGSNLTANAEPIIGLGRIKLQYPAPYYPTITHTYINFARVGFDAKVMRRLGDFAIGGNVGMRYIYNLANIEHFFDQHTYTSELNGEIGYRLSDTISFSFVGGVEVGGWYPKIFFGRGGTRPYFEVGVQFE